MNIVVQVATMPDREYPVAELWYGSMMIGEINQEKAGILVLEIYEPALVPKFDLQEFVDALARAKSALSSDSVFKITGD